MKRIICLTSIFMLASLAAFADIARPEKSPKPVEKPKKSITAFMSIRLDRDAKDAKLIIPKSQIKQLRAALDDMDEDGDSTTAAAVGSFSRIQTIISGVFLSLAFVFGGIWFVRSGKTATKAGKSLLILGVISGIGAAATLVYANVGPPPEARSITSRLFDQKVMSPYRFASGQVMVETTDESESITLIVPDPPKKPGDE